jgi:formylglycine-generating enzyme required for sulfatase activity
MKPRPGIPSGPPASAPGPAAAVATEAEAEAKATYHALLATGVDAFAAIEPSAQGDRTLEAHLWLEALRLVEVQTGSFLMGCCETDPNHQFDKKPGDEHRQRKVIIDRPFLMGAVQTTQGAWEALMGSNSSRFQGDPTLPVEQVSWEDICGPDGFLARLNTLTHGVRPAGTVFRLPSEAEWEYACRAGTNTDYGFPFSPDTGMWDDPMECSLAPDGMREANGTLSDYGWTSDNAGGKTHPVGQKRPNAWGLHDLHGNVFEWCQDTWHDSYKGAPRDGSAWIHGSDADYRVVRGGSWYTDVGYARSVYRCRAVAAEGRDINGFRVVCAQVAFKPEPPSPAAPPA